jgi:hypothetical protein
MQSSTFAPRGARQQGIRFTNSNYKKWLRRGPGSLRVQSQRVVKRVYREAIWLGHPDFADVLVAVASEGLKPLGEVIGHREGLDVRFELAMSAIMVALNCSLLDGSVHPFNLAVGPRMTWLG